jgi:hypothetical protein
MLACTHDINITKKKGSREFEEVMILPRLSE